jgi:hypothetical protein
MAHHVQQQILIRMYEFYLKNVYMMYILHNASK